jgi:phosphotransferase system  glucose/maltose/N-acetylglucosamine-specific IIC component
MTRSVAFRASLLFTACAVLFAVTGFASEVPVAEVLFLISGSLCGIMLCFALATPAHAPVPVRVRRRR